MSDFDLTVEPLACDEDYLKIVRDSLEICLDFEPDLVLYQAGVDGLETDGLGKLSVSREGMMKRNRYVFEIMLENRIPTVVFMGGGYSKPIEHTLDAFYDLFTDAAEWNSRWK